MKTSSLALGIKKLDATLLSSGKYAYYADETSTWYVVNASDIESLITDYIQNKSEDVRNDAYSHWCAGTDSVEATRDQLIELGQGVPCECGEWCGERCSWTGSASQTVVVEYMPDEHRASHEAAGNRGVYPHNGARRIHVSRACADTMIENDGEWCAFVDNLAKGND